MKIVKQIQESKKIEDLKIITLDTFQDYRGEIWTIYSKEFADVNFVADKITISRFGVLRGFHGDSHTAKLITCVSGQMQLAVVDLRENSQTYGSVETFIISDNEPKVVFVPAGCANAHLSLSDKCVFYYKWSKPYGGSHNQTTIVWNDPELGVKWAIENPILSERDRAAKPHQGIYL